jgi:hypothetical protein
MSKLSDQEQIVSGFLSMPNAHFQACNNKFEFLLLFKKLKDAKGYGMIVKTILESAEVRSKLNPDYLKELKNANASGRADIVREIRLKREITRPYKLLKDYVTKFSSVGTRRLRVNKRKSLQTKTKRRKSASSKKVSAMKMASPEKIRRITPVLEDSLDESAV